MRNHRFAREKKALPALLVSVSLLLSGCSAARDVMATATPKPSASPQALNSAAPTAQSAVLKDGSYTARASESYAQENQGWTEYVTIKVENGKIADVEYDAEKDDKKKSETTKDEYPMEPHPSVWIPEIEGKLKNMAESITLDTVTGATKSSEMAQKLYAAALAAARTGESGVVTLNDDGEMGLPGLVDENPLQSDDDGTAG